MHEQRLDERTASALSTYERAVAHVLEQGIHHTLYEDTPRIREVIKTETIFVAAPPAKGWFARLFGG
jgi:hypothetical protein